MLFQHSEIGGILQNMIRTNAESILVLVSGAFVINIRDFFSVQIPVFQDPGSFFMGNAHTFLPDDIDAPGSFCPAGLQIIRGCGTELSAECLIKSGIGIKAECQCRIGFGTALLHGINPVKQSTPQNVLHHRKSCHLLKNAVVMKQRKLCHLRQFSGSDFCSQIVFNVVKALLDHFPVVHILPPFGLVRSYGLMIAQPIRKSISSLAMVCQNLSAPHKMRHRHHVGNPSSGGILWLFFPIRRPSSTTAIP